MFFFFFYLMSIVLMLGCNSWFLIWVSLEINMLSFIALMFNRGLVGSEVCMKYFFIQSLGSGILMMLFYSEVYWFNELVMMVLSYKIGAGPFYFWFPSICDGLSWSACFFLMTFQKVMPLLLMSFLVSAFLWVIILISMVIGVLGCMNQKMMKRFMAYSSVHHIAWILMGNFLSDVLWILYLMMYMLLIGGIVWSMMKDRVLEVGMLKMISSKWSFVLGMLSMGGVPPMLGFFLKWMMIYNLMNLSYMILMLILMMSVLMFYLYFRLSYMLILNSMEMESWNLNMFSMKIMSLDMIYMIGVNIGLMVFMFMI